MLFLDFFLKNEHNCRITNIFKKTDKLSVLLHGASLDILRSEISGISKIDY